MNSLIATLHIKINNTSICNRKNKTSEAPQILPPLMSLVSYAYFFFFKEPLSYVYLILLFVSCNG